MDKKKFADFRKPHAAAVACKLALRELKSDVSMCVSCFFDVRNVRHERCIPDLFGKKLSPELTK